MIKKKLLINNNPIMDCSDCRQSPRNWMQSTVFSFIIRIENEYKGVRRHDVQTFNGRSYASHCH
jgi:hypothetical protein